MRWPRLLLLILAASAAMVGAGPGTTEGASRQLPSRETPPRPLRRAGHAGFSRLPLLIVENGGQTPSKDVVAYVKGRGTTIYFTPTGLTHTFLRDGKRWTVKADFVGAAKVRPELSDRQPTLFSYFTGPRASWHTGLATGRELAYRNLWPGIDLVYRADGSSLKYEYHVAPGADAAQIAVRWRGAESVQIDDTGRLAVATPLGGFADAAPLAWQGDGEARCDVAAEYAIRARSETSQVCGFRIGGYDRTQPLVIDPQVVVYAGYLGGSDSEDGGAIAVDSDGSAYVTAKTFSDETKGFPVSVGPDLTFNGGGIDTFVAKVKPDGTALVWCGYIGGSGAEYGNAIAVDAGHDVYVAGKTSSSEATFPVTVGPDTTYNENGDAFVAKVAADGTNLVWCGYIGGSGTGSGLGDEAYAIAVDGLGRVVVGGLTTSTETDGFPVAVGPGLTYNGGRWDAWLARVKADGSGLDWCGYVGGDSDDSVDAIALDGLGTPYIGGFTRSSETTFPVKVGPDLTYNGTGDAYVAKVMADGTGFVYAGYLGGSAGDGVNGLAVDGAGALFVAGNTSSTEASFPVLAGPDLTSNGGLDAYVAKVTPSGAGLTYCGYIGGDQRDTVAGIGVDTNGNANVGGTTSSDENTFPVRGGLDATANGGDDLYAARIGPSGTLLLCGFAGGTDDEEARTATADADGNVYLAGYTGSNENEGFPLRAGPDLTFNGSADYFIVKVGEASGSIESFFLPKKIRATVNAKNAAKSTLVAAGFFDTGSGVVDLTSPAALDVGGLHFDIPGLVVKGKTFQFVGGGATFTITPNSYGSSRAKFRMKYTGDFTGKVALDGQLALHFKDGAVDGSGTVLLTRGAFALGRIRGALVAPNLFPARATATLAGPGKDVLAVIVGLATNGVTPPNAAELRIGFGDKYSATIPAASFTRKGTSDVFTAKGPGITSAVVDYARETVRIAGKGLDLGAFAQGGNPILITIAVGADQRAVRVRAGRIGKKMKY